MAVVYSMLGVLAVGWALYAANKLGAVAGLPGVLGALVWFGLAWLLSKNHELEERIRRLEDQSRARDSLSSAERAAPEVDLSAPTADSEEAKAALRAAQDLHFEKRFGEAKAAYRHLVERFPDTKQAVVARQQLDNLRGA